MGIDLVGGLGSGSGDGGRGRGIIVTKGREVKEDSQGRSQG